MAQRDLEIMKAFPGSDDSCDNAKVESVNVMLKPSCSATTAVLAAEERQYFLGSLDLESGLSDFDEEGWSAQVPWARSTMTVP